MRLCRSLLVASMGLGLLQAGCLANSDEANAIDDMLFETLDTGDPNGTGGQNGLTTEDFDAHKSILWNAAGLQLTSPTNTYVSALQADAASQVLGYAIKCALSSPISIGSISYPGNNLLSTTSGWSTGGLSVDKREDLMTCMIIHLNPYGVHVPVRLTGQAVTNTLGTIQASQYNFNEALWVARQTAGGGLTFQVWPLGDLQLSCPDAKRAIKTRVCGSRSEATGELPDCHVDVREDLSECSQGMSGTWDCLGHRAIKTMLKTLDVLTLYPTCNPVPQ